MSLRLFGAMAAMSALALAHPGASAQVVASYDNFDVFNDTGETAEGFEIDVEDVQVADLTREFPSNFASPGSSATGCRRSAPTTGPAARLTPTTPMMLDARAS